MVVGSEGKHSSESKIVYHPHTIEKATHTIPKPTENRSHDEWHEALNTYVLLRLTDVLESWSRRRCFLPCKLPLYANHFTSSYAKDKLRGVTQSLEM